MIEALGLDEAQSLFVRLPAQNQLFTLSPNYVAADAIRDNGLKPLFLAYREGDIFWMHSVHRGLVAGTAWFDLQSSYGYGGPVTNSDDSAFLDRAWISYCRWCQTHDILAEFMRFHPLIGNWRYYGGSIMDDRMTVAIPLQQDDLMASYKTRVRTAVRKAQAAGVEAVWQPASAIYDIFPAIYREGMAEIGVDSFYLFGDDYFHALAANPDVFLLACVWQDTWLSGGLFLRGGAVMEYHLSATTEKGRGMGATNLLLHTAALRAREQGLDWLFLGGGTDSREDNPLLFFKRGFSAQCFPYRIGYMIHQPEVYERLKTSHQQQLGTASRILFYRS